MPVMSIGDFFKNAPHARPVNPRPVSFIAISRNAVLPGGQPNPTKRQVAARISGALVFIGGEGAMTARVEARKAVEKRFAGQQTTDDDFYSELTYQLVWRALHEFDDKECAVGSRLFPDVELMREIVEMPEANRLLQEYNKYVAQEHAEVVDQATFRDPKTAGA